MTKLDAEILQLQNACYLNQHHVPVLFKTFYEEMGYFLLK